MTTKPLRIVVLPRNPALTRQFADELVVHFQASERIAATPTAEGLVLDCIWHGDIDLAAAIVHAAYSKPLQWSEPQIQYRTEEVTDAFGKVRQVLMEPVMTVQVQTPEDCAGTVFGDLSSRRGWIQAMDDVLGEKLIRVEVPLSELSGLPVFLREATGGRAVVMVTFSKYAEAPKKWDPDPDEPMSAALRA
jgi:translation elongation factor EF-G